MSNEMKGIIIIVVMISLVVIIGRIVAKRLQKEKPNSEYLESLTTFGSAIAIIPVLGLFVGMFAQAVPEKDGLGAFLGNWYGWPVYVAGLFVIYYVVAFIAALLGIKAKRGPDA